MDNYQRYLKLCHAMQTGVGFKMENNPKDTEPKHLRTGVNIAMRDLASLVELLMQKGIITREEYFKALADGMQIEVESYERLLSEQLGASVKLH